MPVSTPIFYRAFTEGVLRIYARTERFVRDAPKRYPFSYVAIAALMIGTGFADCCSA